MNSAWFPQLEVSQLPNPTAVGGISESLDTRSENLLGFINVRSADWNEYSFFLV